MTINYEEKLRTTLSLLITKESGTLCVGESMRRANFIITCSQTEKKVANVKKDFEPANTSVNMIADL